MAEERKSNPNPVAAVNSYSIMMAGEEEDDGSMNANRKLSVYKHIKKKAANDAQLLMNRIALIQKEEERARKKIDQTKDRAVEILALRKENEQRISVYANATGEVQKLQQVMLNKNRAHENEGKQARLDKIERAKHKKKEEVEELADLLAIFLNIRAAFPTLLAVFNALSTFDS